MRCVAVAGKPRAVWRCGIRIGGLADHWTAEPPGNRNPRRLITQRGDMARTTYAAYQTWPYPHGATRENNIPSGDALGYESRNESSGLDVKLID